MSKHISRVNFFSNYFILEIIVLNVNVFYLKLENQVLGESNKALIVSCQKTYIDNEV